jgi:hypothetical protein
MGFRGSVINNLAKANGMDQPHLASCFSWRRFKELRYLQECGLSQHLNRNAVLPIPSFCPAQNKRKQANIHKIKKIN